MSATGQTAKSISLTLVKAKLLRQRSICCQAKAPKFGFKAKD